VNWLSSLGHTVNIDDFTGAFLDDCEGYTKEASKLRNNKGIERLIPPFFTVQVAPGVFLVVRASSMRLNILIWSCRAFLKTSFQFPQ